MYFPAPAGQTDKGQDAMRSQTLGWQEAQFLPEKGLLFYQVDKIFC